MKKEFRIRSSPRKLAEYLQSNGILIIGEPTDIEDVVDGGIQLIGNLYIQVGEGYAVLSEIFGTGYDIVVEHWKTRKWGSDLLSDIKTRLSI